LQARLLATDVVWHPDVRHAPAEQVFESDTLIPEELRLQLLGQLNALKFSKPESEWDWHPGSHNQVLDVIHPSLYCYVRGTSSLIEGNEAAEPPTKAAKYEEGTLSAALAKERVLIKDTPIPDRPIQTAKATHAFCAGGGAAGEVTRCV
jgi:hypothetical protein